MTKKQINELSFKIIGAAIEVHKIMGTGLLESVYYKCLKREFDLQGIEYRSEMFIPLEYKGMEFHTDFKCDFFIENCIVLEIKAVSEIIPIHEAQVFNYMKLLQVPKGILINFNCSNIFNNGQKTFVNEIFRKASYFVN